MKYNTPKLALDILLPSKVSVIFNRQQRFNYGLEASLNGGLFNNTGASPFISDAVDEAGYSRLIIGPTLAFKLKKVVKINLTGGLAAGRRLEFIDIAEEITDRTPEAGPFFRMGISFIPAGKNMASQPSINL